MIEFKNVCKTFNVKGKKVEALKDINLTINDGEIFGIIGFSGAGKSTLVRCINLLEKPTSGKVFFNEKDLTSLKSKELREIRQNIGMIFQQFNLLAQRNVLQNVCYPLEIAGVKKSDATKRALELLKLVGIDDKANAYPSQLSGGQKQRVGIARALATNPKVLLCDEATSALDPITTRSILNLLKEINDQLHVTIVVITHEMKVVEQICDRVAIVSEGVIMEQGNVKDVFLNPKSDIAKKLILPDDNGLDDKKADNVLRIAFDGQSSSEPIISKMTIACGTPINILGANTENIGGRAFGQMLIELPQDETLAKKVKTYLKDNNITFEESR